MIKRIRNIVIIAYLFIQTTNVFSQFGPGGVGAISEITLWLRAHDIQGLSNLDPVSLWPDTSGNSNDATELGTSRPFYRTNQLNGFPAVSFNGTTQKMDSIFQILNQNMSVISVFSHDHTGNTVPNGPLWATSTTQTRTGFRPMFSDGKQYLATNNWLSKASGYSRNTWYISTIVHGLNSSILYKNSAFDQQTSLNTVYKGQFTLGWLAASNQFYRGYLSELIFYNFQLNKTQRLLIENYLSAKYNISINAVNDLYNYTPLYRHEVGGLGQENSADYHLEGGSGQVIIISDPSDIDDKEYLLFGHNDSVLSWTTNECPNSGVSTQRLKREWRVTRTGDLGTVKIKIDTSYLPVKPAGYTQLVLFIDSDGDLDQNFGTGAVTTYNLEKDTAGYYYVENVSLKDGDFLTVGLLEVAEFVVENSRVGESGGNFYVEVKLNASKGVDVAINYSIIDGNATEGPDYTEVTSGSIVIAAGKTMDSIQVNIIEDNLFEGNEDIIFKLISATNIVIGSRNTHTLIIEDNEYFSTGPGGVGNPNTNLLWFKADDIKGLLNNDPVSIWRDTSGNNYHGVETGISRPTFITNVVNGLPTVRFDGVSQTFDSIFRITNQNMSVISVFNHAQNGSSIPAGPVWTTSITEKRVGFTPVYTNGNQYLATEAWLFKPTSFPQGNWFINTVLHGDNYTTIYKDNAYDDGNSQNDVFLGDFSLALRHFYGQYFKGDISEVIFYNYDLNRAQRFIVNNYLSSKYNIAISNDYYSYDTKYPYDVAGIGRDDASNFHSAAMSAKIIEIGDPSNMDDGEYLLFGHDGDSLNSWLYDNSIDGYRLNRFWRLNETGDLGTVRFRVDTSLLPIKPIGMKDYVIWKYSSSDTTAFPLQLMNNNFYQVNNIDVADGDSLTLGLINTIQFSVSEGNGFEYDSLIYLEVIINKLLAGNVSVDYAVTSGTANAGGVDYTLLGSGTLTITTGNLKDTIEIRVKDDTIVEVDEYFVITLSNPSGISLGAFDEFTYIINDDDFSGYSGPGGVGDSNTLSLWLKTSDIIGLVDGSPVLNWIDSSGHNYDASQTNALYRPIYKTNIINGFPIVRFDGTDDYFDDSYTYYYKTFFGVYSVSSDLMQNTDLGQLWGNYAQAAHVALDARPGGNLQGWSFDGNGATRARYARNGNNYSGYVNNNNASQWQYNNFEIVSVDFENRNSINRQVIGSLVPTFAVGLHQFGGDVSEIILYQKDLNAAQRIIVENYLSTKYNISLTQNDFYSYNASYINELAGIGRVDASNFHTAAMSAGILKITNASSLDDGDFLLFAHNNDSIVWSDTETPVDSAYCRRILREWRFDRTNNIGNVSVSIDTSLFQARPTGFTEMIILIDADADADFSDGASVYRLTQVSSSSEFKAEDVNIPDGYYLSIACFQPIVGFSSSSVTNSENDSVIEFSIHLNLPVDHDITVDITDASIGSAISGSDYYPFNTTSLTIPAGDTIIYDTLFLKNDLLPESDETIFLNLENVVGAFLSSEDTLAFTIEDDDWTREIDFTLSSVFVNENTGTIGVSIQVSLVDGISPTTVDYSVFGTASGFGEDYTLINGTASVIAGNTYDTIFIPINDDLLDEDNETIILKLSNPSNSMIGNNDSITITITDNDPTPSVQFITSSGSGYESNPTLNIEVALSAFSGREISLNYSFSDISATNGVDYTGINGVLTISPEKFKDTIQIPIINNSAVETSESFMLTISSPVNATLGVRTTYTYTIIDDDQSFFTGPAGVGNYLSNMLWLKADSITGLANTNPIPIWRDISGNNNHASQSTPGYRPTYRTGTINGFPTVRFDGTDDYFRDALVYESQNIFAVFMEVTGLQQTNELAQLWGNYADGFHVAPEPRVGAYQYGYSFDGAGTGTARYSHNGEDFGIFSSNTNNPSLWSFDNYSLLSVNFQDVITTNEQIIGSLVPNFGVGVHQFGGELAELIVYNSILNNAQRIIIQNYLSSKYNIGLTQNDFYSYDVAGGDIYYFDVAGFGRIDNDNYHTDAQSAGMLKIGNPDDLGDNEFLLFGHDNGNYSIWTKNEVPSSDTNLRRITREWRVNKTGDVGSVDLALDTTFLSSRTSGYVKYEIWVDGDGDFTNGTSRYALTYSDSMFYASNVALSDGDFITFGIVPISVSFLDTVLSGMESITSIDIIIELSESAIDSVWVPYQVVGGTAIGGGTDYTLINDTALILPGNLYDTILLTINNDLSLEPNENILVSIRNPINALIIGDTLFSYTIIDDDGTGYSGPGGVGNFTNQIDCWLLSTSTSNLSDGNPIGTNNSATEWKDYTGRGLDAWQDIIARQPTFWSSTPNINNRPVVKFIRSNSHYLQMSDNNRMNTAAGAQTIRTVCVAFKTSTDVTSRQVVFEEGGGSRGLNFYIQNDTLRIGGWNLVNDDASTPWSYKAAKFRVNSNTPYFGILQFNYDGSNGIISGTMNGGTPDTLTGTGRLFPHGADIGIGAMVDASCFEGNITQAGNGNYFDGLISELVSGNMIYNSAQIKIVSNYFAAKYAISMGGSDDLYDYDITHGYEVFGIGQVDATNSHSISQGQGFVKISNPSNLNNGEYMLIGHNNDSVDRWDNNEVPDNKQTIRRVKREWRVDKHLGNVGTIRLHIDTSKVSQIPTGFLNYVLMVDADGDFTSGATILKMTDDGDGYYSVSSVNFNKGDFFTIGVIKPAIEFTLSSSEGDEPDSPVDIEVKLNVASASDITVSFSTSDITANASQLPINDYEDTTGILTIPAGNLTATISLTVYNDVLGENDESFLLTLFNPSGGYSIGDDTTHIFTIHDDDMNRKVQFLNASGSGSENSGSVSIELRLTENNPTNPVQVIYTILSSSTADTNDYSLVESDTIIFATNDQIEFINLPILEDNYFESNETVIIELSNPVNANMGINSSFTYTILDNDTAPDIYFSPVSLSGKESISPAKITFALTNASGYEVKADYTIIGGTASGSGVDYFLDNGTITFSAYTTETTIDIGIYNDGDLEPNEYLKIALSNPVYAEITGNDTLIYTIVDDDGFGIVGPGGIGDYASQINCWLLTSHSDNIYDGNSILDNLSAKQWMDYTGNGLNAFQNDPSYQPSFWRLAPTWNKNPVIEFKQNQFLDIADNVWMNTPTGAQTKRTIAAVFRTGTDIETRQVIYEEGGGARGLNFYIEDDTLQIGGWNLADDDATTPWLYTSVKYEVKPNTPYFGILQFNFEGTSGAVSGILNGMDPDTLAGAGKLFPHGADIGIGGMSDAACFESDCDNGDGNYFDGFITEFVSGNIVYNRAQLKIINNYFAAKYNITIPPTEDIYDYSLGYSAEVIGIGQEDALNTHTSAQGSGIIKIDNPSNIADGKYLLIGHDNDSIDHWKTTEVPDNDTNIKRLYREWRIDKQGGDIGTIDLYLDTSKVGVLLSGYTDYVLLVDSDGDFTSDARVIKLEDNNDGYFLAQAVNFTKGDYFTFGIIRPSIQFSLAVSDGEETVEEHYLIVTLNYEAQSNVTVNYATSDITASSSQSPIPDYTAQSGVITILTGRIKDTLIINVSNDAIAENDETFSILLSNPSLGVILGKDSIHTFTIHDDDQTRKLQFTIEGASNNENIDSIYIGIELSDTNKLTNTTVQYRILGTGSASGDSVDFYLLEDTLVIPPFVVDTSILIVVIDDLSDEYDETIQVELFNPTNANLGFNKIFIDTILDDDAAPFISFTVDTLSGMESISPVQLQVVLSVESGRDITVEYSSADITALGSGVDYQLDPDVWTIPAGTDTIYIPMDVFNDNVEEPNEDLLVYLFNPVNAVLNTSLDSIVYRILDNDGLGYVGPGGVGSFTNQIDCWLRSNNMLPAFVDGTPVGTGNYLWQDISGHNINATQTTLNRQPVYWELSPTWNNYPVIEYESTQGKILTIADNLYMNTPAGPQNKRTLLITFRPTNNITSHQTLYEEGGGARGLSFYIINDSLYLGGWNYPDDQGAADPSTPWGYVYVRKKININTPYVAILQFNFDDFGVGTVSGYLNGEYLGALPGAGRLYPHPDDIGIGAQNSGACYHNGCFGGGPRFFFDGYISEFLSGNLVFNDAQLLLVNNYLSAKFNITLPPGDDLYDFQILHGNEVFGIGQLNASNKHNVSQGQGPIMVDNPSDIEDGEFLLIGDNAEEMDNWEDFSVTDVPNNDPNILKLKREWRVDKQGGDIGNIDLSIQADLLPTKAFGYPTYILLVDTNDGDFTDCNIMYELVDNGNGFFKAEDVNFNKGDYFSIALCIPTVSFFQSNSSQFETNLNSSVQIAMNFIPGQTYTFDFATSDISALSGFDYRDTTGTFNFTKGQRIRNLNLILINDLIAESDESFLITLSNPQGMLEIGADTTHSFVIHDDDNARKIEFTRSDSSNSEVSTTVNIRVRLSTIDLINPTKVYYYVSGGTASGSGTDFALTPDTLTINAGDSIGIISFNVINDIIDESDETIIITLSSPINASLGDTIQFSYTIVDNDPSPSIQFETITAIGAESYSPARLEIELSLASGRDITVEYTTFDITAIGGGIDYNQGNGETRVLTIPAGSDSVFLPIDIVNDAVYESTKSLLIVLTNPTFATLNANDTFTYSIYDDDGLGYYGPGGVGHNGQYRLWVRSSSETFANNSNPTPITDFSFNSHDPYAGNTATFLTNQINNRSIFKFNGAGDYYRVARNADFESAAAGYTQKTFVLAFKTSADIISRQVLWEQGYHTRGFNIYIVGGNIYFAAERTDGNPVATRWVPRWVSSPIDTNTEYYAIFEFNSNDSLISGFLNGSYIGGDTSNILSSMFQHNDGNAVNGPGLGASVNRALFHDMNDNTNNDNIQYYFNGDLMEFLSYNYLMNSTQRRIIENYFAAKFRNNIETDIQNDDYAYRASHNYEVFGIGQINVDDNHTVSRGTGIVRIDQPLGLDDGDFLLIGHNNDTINQWFIYETPYDSMYRVKRVWRVGETGDINSLRISVDTSQFDVSPSNNNTFILIVDQDGVFNSGDEKLYPMQTRSGSYYMVDGIQLNDGDYFTFSVSLNRTIQSGFWDVDSIWLIGQVPTDEEDALISKGDTVYIRSNTEVGSVKIDSAGLLAVNGAFEFEITKGDLTNHPDGLFEPNNGTIIFSAIGPQCIGGLNYYRLTVRGSGTKTLCGDINVQNLFMIFQDAPTLTLDVTTNNYSVTLQGNWQNSGIFEPRDGVVTFNGINQRIDRDNNGTETFNNLDIRTTNTFELRDNVQVADSLFLNGCNINTLTDTLTIGSGITQEGVIVKNSGYVVGYLERWMNSNAVFDFPIGTSSLFLPITYSVNNILSGGSAIAQFRQLNPGNSNLSSIWENGFYMVANYTEGYWRVASGNGLMSNNYNVIAFANNFSSVDPISSGTRLLSRNIGQTNWYLNGVHQNAIGDSIRRTSLTSMNRDFAICDTISCNPNTSIITGNDTVCVNSLGIPYSVTNHVGSSYNWLITGGTQASGTSTNSITVNWTTSGNGSVRVVENNGCTTDTSWLNVYVRPYPVNPGAISEANPDTVMEGTSKTYSIAAVLNATSYTWTLPPEFSGSSNADTISITFDPGSAGSTYTIRVVGTNVCGNSSIASQKQIYVDYGLPEKPAKPFGPDTVCQNSQDTIYYTNTTVLADSFEWNIIQVGSNTISGIDTIGTVNWDAAFSGNVGIRVRGLNANGSGPWSDTLYVVVISEPDAILTILAGLDTICDHNNTQLEINFISGLAPFSFTISDGTTSENIINAGDPYTYNPSSYPVWLGPGIYSTYTYTISSITDSRGCVSGSISGPDVSVSKKPDTGRKYFIKRLFNP